MAATLSPFDLGSETRAVELVVAPVAATLTSGGHPNSNAPGRRQEDDINLVACLTGERTHALTAEGADASEDGTGRGTPIVFSHTAGIDAQPSRSVPPTVKAGHDTMPSVATETTVRRLTPTECERLQGFPDGHTATSNGREQADSPRYKQMGNAVAVPMFEWVARRLVAYEERA